MPHEIERGDKVKIARVFTVARVVGKRDFIDKLYRLNNNRLFVASELEFVEEKEESKICPKIEGEVDVTNLPKWKPEVQIDRLTKERLEAEPSKTRREQAEEAAKEIQERFDMDVKLSSSNLENEQPKHALILASVSDVIAHVILKHMTPDAGLVRALEEIRDESKDDAVTVLGFSVYSTAFEALVEYEKETPDEQA